MKYDPEFPPQTKRSFFRNQKRRDKKSNDEF